MACIARDFEMQCIFDSARGYYGCNDDGSHPPGREHQGAGDGNSGGDGLSVSDAIRVFLMRVVAEKQLPFALKVPNAETRAAMEEADVIVRTRRARFTKAADLFDDLAKNRGQ